METAEKIAIGFDIAMRTNVSVDVKIEKRLMSFECFTVYRQIIIG